jgi:hypothetical protein
MALDTSGRWWRGTEFADLAAYLRALTADAHPVGDVRQCVCRCGGMVFRLLADADEGCVLRVCVACGERAFIADSAEAWDDASPEPAVCPCGAGEAELGVGFSDRAEGEVRWITVGQRCARCGVLASAVDWEVDYAPTAHLRSRV